MKLFSLWYLLSVLIFNKSKFVWNILKDLNAFSLHSLPLIKLPVIINIYVKELRPQFKVDFQINYLYLYWYS